MKTCEFCAQALEVELLDYWLEERDFLLATCCEERYSVALEDLHAALDGEPEARRAFARWFEAQTGQVLRRPFEDLGAIRLDYGLELGQVTLAKARTFVLEHHRHNRPPAGWRWGHGVWNGPDLVGVAMVGRPVARRLDASTIVEVNRVCVNPELPQALAWNACSMLYGAAAREAKRRGFERIVTYTLESEAGTTLRAAGWEPVAKTRGGSWNRPSRAREDTAPICRKVRWERRLRKAQALRRAA